MNVRSAAKVCMTCGAGYPADSLFCPDDGTPLASARGNAAREGSAGDDAYLGREILDHIELQQLAGVGAMGRVYRAHQRGIDRDVAVKILHRELSANTQLVQRFHREAKVASRLSHPNVVQVHLAGQLPDGALYIVMEYLDGLSLQSALAAAGGSMDLVRALRITLQICDAAGEGHAQGVVHRDLKPENVMLVRRADDPDTVKVLDFGIARLNWGEQSMATAAGLIFGTARYISPEGAQGEAVGPAGDVYAIATLLYQMLCGHTPFDSEQAVALLVQQIHDTPPPLQSWPRASYVPDLVARAVMANLAKEPTAREPDARAFGRTLLDAAVRSGIVESELIARSSLLTARYAGSLQLASLQRTAGLGPTPPSPVHPSALGAPPGDGLGATQKWTPDATTTPLGSPRGGGFPATHSPRVAATATDALATVDRAGAAGRVERVDHVDAGYSGYPGRAAGGSSSSGKSAPPVFVSFDGGDAGKVPRSPPSPSRPVGAAPLSPPGDRSSERPPRTEITERPLPAPRYDSASRSSSRPPRIVDEGEDDEEDEVESESPRRAYTRTAGLVLLCFLVGVLLAGGVAFRLKLIGPEAKGTTLDAQLARARSALDAKRWDSPPGDNVRDLTGEGLAKWPNDPRLLELRARATDELDLAAVRHELAGDMPEALHLAELARELDPSDSTATHLAEKYEALESALAPDASIPAPSSSSPGTSVKPSSGRVLLEVTPTHARLGQALSIVAHVTRGGVAVDPHFDILFPGAHGQPDRVPANPDTPSTFRGAYTVLEKGHYEVVFSAKIDGVPVRVARAITASADGAVPAPASDVEAGAAPQPAPSGSVKWL